MRRRSTGVVAGALLLALASSTAAAQTTSGLEDGLAQTEQQRQATERDLADRRAEEGDARARLSAATAEHQRAEAALAEIAAALTAAEGARDTALGRADELREDLAAVEDDLVVSEGELAVVQDRFGARVAGAYKRGATRTETALVGQMLTQDSIADALATAPFLTAVLNSDRRVVDDVTGLLDEVEQQRAVARQLRVDAEREVQEADRQTREAVRQAEAQEEATTELAALATDLDAAHDAIVTDRRAVESHLASIDAESSRIEGELRAIAQRRAAEAAAREEADRQAREEAERLAAAPPPATTGGGSSSAPPSGGDTGGGEASPPPSSGGWRWPAACQRVTSRYGPRNVVGGSRNHPGVDIACTRVLGPNPPIYASRGGVVAPVNCGGGYGICVIVDHLDGDFTLYAHLSGLAVGSGSNVSGGQVIGSEGSTGNSTGPHLHFELWKGGSKADPCPYIGC